MSSDRHRRYDAKRRYDKPWRNLYKTKRWAQIRQHQLHLQRTPTALVVATVVHHANKHEGDPLLFWNGPFESLCKPCHDSDAQQEERYGYSLAIGADGWPLDPKHPMNR